MSIIKTLFRNSTSRSRTLKPDDMPEKTALFKGLIQHDPDLCTGCRNCNYVCSPKAITFNESKSDSIAWEFFAGQCTFCDLCVQFCPTQALSNSGEDPVVTSDPSVLTVSHWVDYEPCSSCGSMHIPVPFAAAVKLFGEATEDSEALRVMCPSCRKKAAGQKVRDAFIGKEAAK